MGVAQVLVHQTPTESAHGEKLAQKKLGVYIALSVSVMVFCAIVATVALDVQEETVEVTKYDYVTSTTSLFEYDQSPQYIEYDLARNYTGYYTSVSDPYWGGVGTNGDGYYTTETVNRYILNLAPADTLSDTLNLRDSSLQNAYDATIYTYKGTGPADYYYDANYVGLKVISLSDYLNEQSLNSYTKITFTQSASANPVLFISENDLIPPSQPLGAYRGNFTLAEYAEYHQTITIQGVTYDIPIAPLSAELNTVTGTLSLYSSPTTQDSSTYLRTIEIDDACIVYSTASATSPNPYGYTIHIEAETLPATEYLDITKGVRVSP